MNIEDAATSPLPRTVSEPLLLLLDIREARRIWVMWILGLAHYHVYAPATATEAVIWFLQHPVAPRAILVGDLYPHEQGLIQLLFRRYAVQSGRQIPIVALADDAPETVLTSEPFSSLDPRQGMDLLELLWREVSRSL